MHRLAPSLMVLPAALGLALASAAYADTLTGTAGDDVIVGTPGDDVLSGGPGRDRLIGEGGLDVSYGGGDRDELVASSGDRAYGGSGGDRLVLQGARVGRGGEGEDTVLALTGFDDAGVQVLRGDVGADHLRFGSDNVQARVYGGAGADEMGAPYLHFVPAGGLPPGHVGLLSGGEGDDELVGDAERYRGGEGDDIVRIYDHEPSTSVVSCGAGADIVVDNDMLSTDPRDTVDADCEDVRIFLTATPGTTELLGTPHRDFMTPAESTEVVRGFEGDDELGGSTATMLIDAGPGDDAVSTAQQPGTSTVVVCGPGEDRVAAGPDDVVATDCEHVLIS